MISQIAFIATSSLRPTIVFPPFSGKKTQKNKTRRFPGFLPWWKNIGPLHRHPNHHHRWRARPGMWVLLGKFFAHEKKNEVVPYLFPLNPALFDRDPDTLKGINISHLGKRKLIFKTAIFGGYVSSLEGNRDSDPCYNGLLSFPYNCVV